MIKVLGIAVTIWGLSSVFNFGSLSQVQMTSAWLSTLCGISYIGFCMAAMLRNPRRATRVLAIVGLGCSLIFLTGPGFESQVLASVFSLIRSGLVLVGIAAMLHFLLIFPNPGPLAQSKRKIAALYIPAFLCWLLVGYWAQFVADDYDALNSAAYVLTGLVLAGYFLAGVIVFLRRYIRTPREKRGPSGLRLMLWGSIIGFLPAIIGYMPALSAVPGNQYFFVSLALLPIAWSGAVSRVLSQ